jgi:hypothetical protein
VPPILEETPSKRPQSVFGIGTAFKSYEHRAAIQLLQIVGTRRLELLTSTGSNLGPESDGAIPKASK